MVTIKTDRDYFQYTPDGVEIHSGNTAVTYDHYKLKNGKILPPALIMGKDIWVDRTERPDVFIWKIS